VKGKRFYFFKPAIPCLKQFCHLYQCSKSYSTKLFINCRAKIHRLVVKISLTYKRGFRYSLPGKASSYQYNYNVRGESFFAGRHPQPSISAAKGKCVDIKISGQEWIFPTSGVIFIWDVENMIFRKTYNSPPEPIIHPIQTLK